MTDFSEAQTFQAWSDMGYRIKRGAKAHWKPQASGRSLAVFMPDQVWKPVARRHRPSVYMPGGLLTDDGSTEREWDDPMGGDA